MLDLQLHLLRFRGSLIAALLTACSSPPAAELAACARDPDPATLTQVSDVRVASGDRERGSALFRTQCEGCHAPLVAQRSSRFFRAYPRLDCSEYLARASDGYLFTAIFSGGAAGGREETMKAFSESLSERDIGDLIAFLRTSAGPGKSSL